MQVHGGTTDENIEAKVQEAQELAKYNRRAHNIDTVMFFDEANTTDAIELIKEVMCDQRVLGEEVGEGLQFVAACNPYRKSALLLNYLLCIPNLITFTFIDTLRI